MTSIVQVGLGPLGRKVVQFAVERGFDLVGAVDSAPDLRGRELGGLCDLEPLGVVVQGSLAEALLGREADVAVLTTVSSLATLEPQIVELAEAGLHTVSTCEELSFPWNTHPNIARRIDRVCAANGVVCLGTGVNPGYLMDFLPTVMTAACQSVDAIRVWRVQDAAVRRVPFQQKIGAGLTVDAFRAKQAEGTLRHVGLVESMDLIAHRMGWTLDRKSESLEPVLAETDVTSGYTEIKAGMARGVEQIGRGFVDGWEAITLHFRAAVGEPEPYDRIQIEGEPPIDSTIAGGVNGDTATCAITLNAIRSARVALPGLRTMSEIPAVAYSAQP